MATSGGSSRRARGIRSALNMLSGISLSIVPPAVLSISSNTFPIEQQGWVAVAIVTATFLGQLAFGAIVEARLGSAESRRFVAMPRWLTFAGLAGALLMIVLPGNPIAICAALPLVFAALETGRGVSIAEKYAVREAWSALALGAGAAVGVGVAIAGQSWGLAVLGVGVAATVLIRAIRAPHLSTPPNPSVRAWVVTDVALTGVSYPVLNAIILGLLGPIAATAFAAVSTVSGLLAVPLNFLRVRLLKEHSLLDTVVTSSALVAAGVVIAVGEITGLFGIAFGASWTTTGTALPLFVACLWRVSALFSALPFAALRRAGHARLVTILRAASAVFTFAIAIPATFTHEIWVVFAALLLGQMVLAVICEIARRRTEVPTPPLPEGA